MFTPLLLLSLAEASTIRSCPDAIESLPAGLEDVKKRVVRVQTVLGTGSGAILSPDGFVLTAAHVVGDAKRVEVVLLDESVLEGVVVRRDASADVALIRVEAEGMPCLGAASARATTGADLFLIGSPGGEVFSHSVTKGVVSGYRELDGVDVLQTDASLSPGYSGGPVLGLDGSIQGVTSFKVVADAVEGLGFASTLDDALVALDVQLGEETDLNVEVSVDAKPVMFEFAEIADRPAEPRPPIEKKPCRGVDVKVGEDAFSGARVVTARGADLFEYRYVAAEGGSLTLFFPMRSGLTGINSDATNGNTYNRPATVDIKLEDGTTIKMKGSSLPSHKIGGFNAFIVSDFPLSKGLVEALASSGPVVERWTFSGDPVDFERSSRQREKYFRPYFSCLLSHWTD